MSKAGGKVGNGTGRKLNRRNFVLNAIDSLRRGKYKGIHVVYSGFNEAYREYYGEDPREYIDELVETGIIAKRIVRGGIIILRAEDARDLPSPAGQTALQKILTR